MPYKELVIIAKLNASSLYFSDRLKEKLDKLLDYSLTIVEAPMGYGKTTAIREYLRNTNTRVLWQMIFDNSIDNFWNGFCNLFDELDEKYSEKLKKLGFPNDNVLMYNALSIINNIDISVNTALVLDDYHVIDNLQVNSFIEFLVKNEIDNLHIILITRFTEMESLDELKLKGYAHHITKETFELRPKEIIRYYRLCGISLKDNEADNLYSTTEGWISAVYLIMLNYIEEGTFTKMSNIYSLINKAVYTPFSEEIKELLLILCIFDSFTIEQASYMWGKENTHDLLNAITTKNSFIKYFEKTKTYQIHDILKKFLKETFESKNFKNTIYHKAALWYFKTKDYWTAMRYFCICGDFENFLLALEEDRSNSIYVDYKNIFIAYMEECPGSVKGKHPIALLIYALYLFTVNEFELFSKICNEIILNLENNKNLSDELRNQLLGEFELLICFKEYNNIVEMSKHIQNACRLLDRPAVFMDSKGLWTFGSPSVLFMFYRETGKLEEHVKDIKEAMPYYYQLTNGHGMGAEYIMEAERYFNLGDFENAEIIVHKALYAAERKMDIGIITCAMFLKIRLAFVAGDFTSMINNFEKMHKITELKMEYIIIYTIDICEGYIYSLLNKKDKITKWVSEGNFNSSRLLFPTFAMVNIVYGRVLLISKEYLKLIGITEHFIEIASFFPNILGQIHTYIYHAAANNQIYKETDALSSLKLALDIALPDKIYMPFVENCDFIKPLLEALQRKSIYVKEINEILKLYTSYKKSVDKITNEYYSKSEKPKLTTREKEIADLAANGFTNKEIAESLFISTNTVKTNLKNIFEKLNVNSRALLKQCLDDEKFS